MSQRLPAEWEPQSGVMLTWPHGGTDWSADLAAVEATFFALGAAIAARETLLCVCPRGNAIARITDGLVDAGADRGRLRFAVAPSDDTWARDHGAIVTVGPDGAARVNDFVFNGWGGKFAATRDDAITRRLHGAGVFGAAPLQREPLVLEGGAIETDGRGTLLATRSSVLTATRNPRLDQAAFEYRIHRVLGLNHFLWLDNGALDGDDTDGHIDTLARFADPDTILYQTAAPDDPDYPALAAMAEELARFRTVFGQPYRLLPLPPPGIHRDDNGRRLPASYANFLLINGAVLVPGYGVAADIDAAAVLAGAFPDREVVLIDCRAIIRQNGSLHCLTMHFPAAIELHDGTPS